MKNPGVTAGRSIRAVLLVAMALLPVAGCEVDSFMDPARVGRWERTAAIQPILSRLDVIEPKDPAALVATPVNPGDLIPDVQEYVLGPSDLILVSVFELIMPGQESLYQRRVDATGYIRLPVLGSLKVGGRSPSRLERAIGEVLEKKGILRDPTVSVIVQEARQNTFSIIGEPGLGQTAFGTYPIPSPNFRLIEALAVSRGISERTKKLLVFRQVALSSALTGEGTLNPAVVGPGPMEDAPPAAPQDPEELIEDILEGLDQPPAVPAPDQPTASPAAPAGIERGLDPSTETPWIYMGGKWVRAEKYAGQHAAGAQEDEFSGLVTQRLIEVPYERLIQGDMRYNIVIRPGDIIRVPGQAAGFVYLMGSINRPGAYIVPGEDELTVKQVIASGGNLSPIAIPERVDLVRRIGSNQEATVRINLRAIFEGHQPDFFLKPNDLLNIGTNFVATPLAIFRSGFRSTYGFGFVVDRNFGVDVFPFPR